ncbi:ABC transporter ATP-binding protein [uncultured Succinivibrio sp.]|uniref:ABC transporter ATP-binding protein n=1 Tax=uncultured Succinivibrio sp. TaxID=540749 RepID=UPI00343582D2
MLEIKNLFAGYGQTDTISNINLNVDKGETVSVLGANTAGKTTLLRTISGLTPRKRGSILFDGSELLDMEGKDIPALGIGHVPEGRHVFPKISVIDNLYLGAYSRQKDPEIKSRLEDIFELFPRLKERYHQLAGTLSGGEQQMVAIGRALMGKPQLLLLDEPSHGLAPIVVDEVHCAIEKIAATGVAVLLVEQNAALALQVAKRGFVLSSGSIVIKGTSSELAENPDVKKAYLGA